MVLPLKRTQVSLVPPLHAGQAGFQRYLCCTASQAGLLPDCRPMKFYDWKMDAAPELFFGFSTGNFDVHELQALQAEMGSGSSGAT